MSGFCCASVPLGERKRLLHVFSHDQNQQKKHTQHKTNKQTTTPDAIENAALSKSVSERKSARQKPTIKTAVSEIHLRKF